MEHTYESVLERIIEDGIKEAKQSYSRPVQRDKLEGSLAGFSACRNKTPKQLNELFKRAFRDLYLHYGQEDYFYHRCFQSEVEWTCNVMSAVLEAQGLPRITSVTYRGIRKAAEIIGIAE